MKKTALVFSGGGGRGAYQVGVWKAIKKLRIKIDIVTGTSVGSLNAALFVQNDFNKAIHVWENIDYSLVFSNKEQQLIDENANDFTTIKLYLKNTLKGGVNISGLESLIKGALSVKSFRNSRIDYAFMIYDLSANEPFVLNKENMDYDLLADYLIASCSVYPVFSFKKIKDHKYVDGGYYDNLPINPAIDLGATNIIAIDLSTIGFIDKPKKDIDVLKISPVNDIGNFLQFEKEKSILAIKYGYYDAMKAFGKMFGHKYTFHSFSFKLNKRFNEKKFYKNLEKFNKKTNSLAHDILVSFKKKSIKKREDAFVNGLEHLLKAFEFEEYTPYNSLILNWKFKKIVRKTINLNDYTFDKKFDDKKKVTQSKALIKYFYVALLQNRDITNISTIFLNEYLAAVYLYTIVK